MKTALVLGYGVSGKSAANLLVHYLGYKVVIVDQNVGFLEKVKATSSKRAGRQLTQKGKEFLESIKINKEKIEEEK